MPQLIILAEDEIEYRRLIEAAALPTLKIVSEPSATVDIALGEPRRIRTALNSLPALAWAQAIWAGVEPLLDPALRRDYKLSNARSVFGRPMSEYVIGYMLAHERRMFHKWEAQKANTWEGTDTGSIFGKQIGLLGVGSIGAEIARTAKFFGMKVRGVTLDSEDSPNVDAYYHRANSLEFARDLDYLVSVLPNTANTRKIVDADLLGALPAHAVFINVGRGAAVDESALIEALTDNRLAGAVLDVFEQEPLPKGHPYWTTPNLLMTFHTAAPSLPEDIVKIFIENYALYIERRPLKYQVDFERGY